MGDRGNIIIKDGDSKVFLYTHWAGYRVADTIRKALKRGKDRWGDGQYLGRIMFCELVPKEKWEETTSYGISSTMGDGFEGADIMVDVDTQEVVMYDGHKNEPVGQRIKFDLYANGAKLPNERGE